MEYIVCVCVCVCVYVAHSLFACVLFTCSGVVRFLVRERKRKGGKGNLEMNTIGTAVVEYTEMHY